jgi:hypothetical protein
MFPSGFGGSGAGVNLEVAELIRRAGLGALWCGEGPVEAYRVTWDRDFRASLVAELVRVDGRWRATGVRFTDPRQDPTQRDLRYRVAHRGTREVPDADARGVADALEAAGIWSGSRSDDSSSTGGAWVVEARSDGAYQALPRSSGPHGQLGDAALQLARLASVWPIPE